MERRWNNLEFITDSLDFERAKGSGPRIATKDIVFDYPVIQATALLTGTDFRFSEDDHHLGRVDVKVDATVSGNTVTVTATFGLRDWSGSWNDKYEGTVYFAVIAEVQIPVPRASTLVPAEKFRI